MMGPAQPGLIASLAVVDGAVSSLTPKLLIAKVTFCLSDPCRPPGGPMLHRRAPGTRLRSDDKYPRYGLGEPAGTPVGGEAVRP